MKICLLTIFISFNIYVSNLNGQNGIEGTFNYVRILETNFLDIPNYREMLGNPLVEDYGLIPSNRAIGLELDLNWVKKINDKFQLVFSTGIVHRQEQAICFCHVCGKIYTRSRFLDVNNIDLGVAGRILLATYNNSRFNLESGIRLPVLGNRKESKYVEFELKSVITRDIGNGRSIKLVLGYEKALGNYNRDGIILGIGIAKLMERES